MKHKDITIEAVKCRARTDATEMCKAKHTYITNASFLTGAEVPARAHGG